MPAVMVGRKGNVRPANGRSLFGRKRKRHARLGHKLCRWSFSCHVSSFLLHKSKTVSRSRYLPVAAPSRPFDSYLCLPPVSHGIHKLLPPSAFHPISPSPPMTTYLPGAPSNSALHTRTHARTCLPPTSKGIISSRPIAPFNTPSQPTTFLPRKVRWRSQLVKCLFKPAPGSCSSCISHPVSNAFEFDSRSGQIMRISFQQRNAGTTALPSMSYTAGHM